MDGPGSFKPVANKIPQLLYAQLPTLPVVLTNLSRNGKAFQFNDCASYFDATIKRVVCSELIPSISISHLIFRQLFADLF
jgi:hypothetical protein